uniref:hypothetical protein n=1 Tax=Endozoicomonas sp. ONNA2 TaxID=2828741 RepID=UPI0021483547
GTTGFRRFQRLLKLRIQESEKDREMERYLLHESPAGANAYPTQPIAARSVSYPTSISPIQKLMRLDENNDLSKALNSLVIRFNNEISDFQENYSSEDETTFEKAHGLTRIPRFLNDENYVENPLKESMKQESMKLEFHEQYIVTGGSSLLNEVNLKGFGLQMNISDFPSWFLAIKRLSENTLLCCKTDTANNPDNNALVMFLDKLLNIELSVDYWDIQDIIRIKDELKRGETYCGFDANTVDRFISYILTETWDVKVFRDTLDSLLTLYEFKPFPHPPLEITEKLNDKINTSAMRLSIYTHFRKKAGP